MEESDNKFLVIATGRGQGRGAESARFRAAQESMEDAKQAALNVAEKFATGVGERLEELRDTEISPTLKQGKLLKCKECGDSSPLRSVDVGYLCDRCYHESTYYVKYIRRRERKYR